MSFLLIDPAAKANQQMRVKPEAFLPWVYKGEEAAAEIDAVAA